MPTGVYTRNFSDKNLQHLKRLAKRPRTLKQKEYYKKLGMMSKNNKEFINKRAKALLGHSVSEETRRKIVLGHLGRKLSNSHISSILRSNCAKPNKFEVRALAYLNSIFENKFRYTGDGSFIINHRSADAYSEELKTIALFNGIYWHLKRYGFNKTEQAKGAVELIESIPFLEAGYKVIFIWEDELDIIIRRM